MVPYFIRPIHTSVVCGLLQLQDNHTAIKTRNEGRQPLLYAQLTSSFSFLHTAWVLSIGLGMMFLFAPIASAVCERIGSRLTAIIGGVIAILGFVSSSFVSDLYVLYLTFGLLWGIGASFSYLQTLTTLPFWFYR